MTGANSDTRYLQTVNPDDDLTPHTDTDLEREVLAAIITAPPNQETTTTHVLAAITPHTFTTTTHRDIHHAITTAWDNGHELDGATVHRHLTTPIHPLDFNKLLEGHHSIALAEGHVHHLNNLANARNAYALSNHIRLLTYTTPPRELPTALNATLTEALNTTTTNTTPTHTWNPVDLTDALNGTRTATKPTILTRTDGTPLIYPGKIHSISGEPTSGKSWFALLAVAQQLTNGHNALYIDFEDDEYTLTERLLIIGVPKTNIQNHLTYIHPHEALSPNSTPTLTRLAATTTLTILDGITEAMTLHGLSLKDNEDIAKFLHILPRTIARQGPAVLQIDHVVKNEEARARWAIGGQHKLAGIDGVAYTATITKSLGRGLHGQTRIIVAKDRPGYIGGIGHTAAMLNLDSTQSPDGTHSQLWLDTAAPETTPQGTFRPTGLMQKISDYLTTTPGATKTAIEHAIKGRTEYRALALQNLIDEGHIATTKGDRNATLHTLITPYSEADDHPT